MDDQLQFSYFKMHDEFIPITHRDDNVFAVVNWNNTWM